MSSGELVEVEPFQAWLAEEIARLDRDETVTSSLETLATALLPHKSLDSALKQLNRWKRGVRASSADGVKGDFADGYFPVPDIEEALFARGLHLEDIYPERASDVDLEPDGFCAVCHEMVTPIEGLCPWCDHETSTGVRERRHCARCDRMVFAANDDTCWRCGNATTRDVPREMCACDCGTEIKRFDPWGRRIQYVRGHAPRSLERDREIAAEPFVAYLEDRLRNLDVIGALAREQGIARDALVALLARRDDTVSRGTVRRSLWVAARNGQGKGMPPRPDATGFFDLYPHDGRSKVCPGCGGGKAPHAAMCKQCRKSADKRDGVSPPRAELRLREDLIAEAYERYTAGATVLTAAESIFERTPHRNVASTAQGLSKAWRDRGWTMRDRTPVAA